MAESAYEDLKRQTRRTTRDVLSQFSSEAHRCISKLDEAFKTGVKNAKEKSHDAVERLHKVLKYSSYMYSYNYTLPTSTAEQLTAWRSSLAVNQSFGRQFS